MLSGLFSEDREIDNSGRESGRCISSRLRGCRGRAILSRSLAGLVVLFLLSAGCTMVGPNYMRPETPEPREWIEEDDPKIKSEAGDFSTWWTAFDDPVLNDLVETAYQ
ncbi:MAG: hypothetical protein GTN74_07050, partial [Proteobacteria bacterium]|nr:hypothetical protein [Pseudomonadota bacterium]NIS69386.1 hypothetical protein [Pseudomonadota bacterium]